jgi:copper chaperone CopZ
MREVAIVNAVSAYLHALDGRLRVKVAAVKGSPQKAQEIECQLQQFDGLKQVTANPTTGSVLILYDPRRITQEKVLETLKTLGHFQENGKERAVAKNPVTTEQGFGRELLQTLVRSTVESAVQRLVYALI